MWNLRLYYNASGQSKIAPQSRNLRALIRISHHRPTHERVLFSSMMPLVLKSNERCSSTCLREARSIRASQNALHIATALRDSVRLLLRVLRSSCLALAPIGTERCFEALQKALNQAPIQSPNFERSRPPVRIDTRQIWVYTLVNC